MEFIFLNMIANTHYFVSNINLARPKALFYIAGNLLFSVVAITVYEAEARKATAHPQLKMLDRSNTFNKNLAKE